MKSIKTLAVLSAMALMSMATLSHAGHHEDEGAYEVDRGSIKHHDKKAYGEHKGHYKAKMLKMMDTDKDGAISKDEFSAYTDKRFAKMDKNGDGSVTKDEMRHSKSWKKDCDKPQEPTE